MLDWNNSAFMFYRQMFYVCLVPLLDNFFACIISRKRVDAPYRTYISIVIYNVVGIKYRFSRLWNILMIFGDSWHPFQTRTDFWTASQSSYIPSDDWCKGVTQEGCMYIVTWYMYIRLWSQKTGWKCCYFKKNSLVCHLTPNS